jgi:hypothetical protein
MQYFINTSIASTVIPLAIVTYIPYEILVSNLYFSILYTYSTAQK